MCHTSACMKPSVIVWDLETVPDLGGFAAANDLVGKSDVEVREAIGDKFSKHIYHSIALHRPSHCALGVRSLGGGRCGRAPFGREDREITAFCDKIAELSPQLVTFNGNSFDLPVLTSPALRRQQAARRAPAPGPQVSSSSSTSPIMSATSSSSSSCSSIKGASPKAGPSSSTSSSASSSAPSITSPSAVFLP